MSRFETYRSVIGGLWTRPPPCDRAYLTPSSTKYQPPDLIEFNAIPLILSYEYAKHVGSLRLKETYKRDSVLPSESRTKYTFAGTIAFVLRINWKKKGATVRIDR